MLVDAKIGFLLLLFEVCLFVCLFVFFEGFFLLGQGMRELCGVLEMFYNTV